MKLFLLLVLSLWTYGQASVIPINPVATTYGIATTPVITAHSHQVVARHFNRVYVPTVPTTIATTGVTYPGYATSWGSYPYGYRYSYSGYPYGYTYPYGTTVW